MGKPNVSTNIATTTSASANRFVTSTNMKVGAYTLAATTMPTGGARRVTVTHTTNTGTDTLGTIVVVGKGLAGDTITDTITPVADSTATGTKAFKTITSVTGAGWVISGGNDTITVGCDAPARVVDGAGTLRGIVIVTTTASTIVIADASGTLVTLPASIAVGSYLYYDLAFSGYLSFTLNGASNVVVIHSPSVPTYTVT